eukprot:TCALIF_07650-PA protein Name:"Protein of unknown function" AED:0.13 eAED:0.13 QI:0/0.33/0.5/0.5/1/1/4/516/219
MTPPLNLDVLHRLVALDRSGTGRLANVSKQYDDARLLTLNPEDPGVGDPLSFLSSSSVSSHTSRVRRSPLEFSHPLHIGSSISYFRSPAEIQPTSMSYAPSRPRNRIQTRRTLPFQLVSQPLLGYAHSRSYVGEPRPVQISDFRSGPSMSGYESDPSESQDTMSGFDSEATDDDDDQSDPRTRASAHRTRAKAADILSMLNSLTEDLQNQKHRLRFGFF